jgi:LacI family transcriptional regulator
VNGNVNDNKQYLLPKKHMLIKKRVTIKEVAQAAGISTQTVSRVLNDRPDVSSETRERVQAIISELGYSPNVLARSLIQGRTNTIGVVGYGLSYYGPARVLTGIERRANELGYSLLLSLLREPETNDGIEVFQNLLSRQVDGIIWAVPEIGSNRDWVVEQTQRLNIPVVFINMEPVAGLSVAAVDNRQGGWLATNHLLEQGYRRIGIITGPSCWWESQQREQGWRQAMEAAGQTNLDDLKTAGDWYPSGGAGGMKELLHRSPDMEAVFACNDPMAAGALQAARRLGRECPQDLAVVGYDDVPEAAYYAPALTTVRQPLAELGSQAVETLTSVLYAGGKQTENQLPQIVWMQPQLIIRDSSIR